MKRVTTMLFAATAACAISLTALSGAANAAPAGTDPCGVTMEYSAWKDGAPGVSGRTDYWSYYNCGSSTVHKKVVINNHSDSGCITIGAHVDAAYSWNETDSVVGHYGAYNGTVNC
jgi:hypothetical protein